MLTSLVQSLSSALGDALEWWIDMFLEALSIADLNSYLSVFPLLSTFYTYLRSFAVALTAIIAGKSLATFAMGSIDNGSAKDNPAMILVKTFAAVALVYWGGYILEYIVYLGSIPYDAFLKINAADWTTGHENNGWLLAVLGVAEFATGIILPDLAYALVELFVLVVIGWNIIKLSIEVCERWLMVGVLVFTSPLAYSTIPSNDTSQIFKRWVSMFVGAVLQMSLSVMFLKLILSGFNGNNTGFMIKLLMILAMCKIAQRVDSYLQQLGIGAPTTGGSMLDDLIAGYNTLRNFGGQNKNNNDDGSGGSRQSILGKAFSRSHLANAVGAASEAVRSGKTVGDVAKAGVKGYWNSMKNNSPIGRKATDAFRQAKAKQAEKAQGQQGLVPGQKKGENSNPAKPSADGKPPVKGLLPDGQTASQKSSAFAQDKSESQGNTAPSVPGTQGEKGNSIPDGAETPKTSAPQPGKTRKPGTTSETQKKPSPSGENGSSAKAEKPTSTPSQPGSQKGRTSSPSGISSGEKGAATATAATAAISGAESTKPSQNGETSAPSQKPHDSTKPSSDPAKSANQSEQKSQPTKPKSDDGTAPATASSGATSGQPGQGSELDPKTANNKVEEKVKEDAKPAKESSEKNLQGDKQQLGYEQEINDTHSLSDQGAALDPRTESDSVKSEPDDSSDNSDATDNSNINDASTQVDQGAALDPQSMHGGDDTAIPATSEAAYSSDDTSHQKSQSAESQTNGVSPGNATSGAGELKGSSSNTHGASQSNGTRARAANAFVKEKFNAAKESVKAANEAVKPYSSFLFASAAAFGYLAGFGDDPVTEDARDIERNNAANQEAKNEYATQYRSGDSPLPDQLATEAKKQRNGERAHFGNARQNQTDFGIVGSKSGQVVEFNKDDDADLSDQALAAGIGITTRDDGKKTLTGSADAIAEYIARGADREAFNESGDRTYAADVPQSRQSYVGKNMEPAEEYRQKAAEDVADMRSKDQKTVRDYQGSFGGEVSAAGYAAYEARRAVETLKSVGADDKTIQAAEQAYQAAENKLHEATVAAGEAKVSEAREKLNSRIQRGDFLDSPEHRAAEREFRSRSEDLNNYIESHSHDDAYYARAVETKAEELRSVDARAYSETYDNQVRQARDLYRNVVSSATPYEMVAALNNPAFHPMDCDSTRSMAERVFQPFLSDMMSGAHISHVEVVDHSTDGERSIRVDYPKADGTVGSVVFFNEAATAALPLQLRQQAGTCKTADGSMWGAIGAGINPGTHMAATPRVEQVRRNSRITSFFSDIASTLKKQKRR